MAREWTTDEEAERLHKRFDALKADQGMGQAEFARLHNVPGGASMLSQHIKGRRPINLEAAIAYAAGFNVDLSEISPRLAAEVARAKMSRPAQSTALMTGEEPATYAVSSLANARRERWPYPRVDFDKLVGLQGVDARHLENALLAAAGDLDLDIRVARAAKSRSG